MDIEQLKKEVVHAAGRMPHTPKDFELLSTLMKEKTDENISPTTLKRFFGYLHEDVRPRNITLNTLARFVGYADFDAFTLQAGKQEVQSNIVFSKHLSADTLPEDTLICLTWLPDRKCIIRHLGEGRFEVTEAENTKLCVGDTFTSHLFIRHEPLYMEQLVRNDSAPACFVAGKKDGICFRIVEN